MTTLLLVEKIIAEEIAVGIEAEQPYREIYQAVKNRLTAFSAVGILTGKEDHT